MFISNSGDDGTMDYKQTETFEDIKLLFECMKCQSDNIPAFKQAVATISQICTRSGFEAKECLRNSGCLDYLEDVVLSHCNTQVKEAVLYTLGCAVEGCVYSQRQLSTPTFFDFLHEVLVSPKSSSKLIHAGTYLIICLVANNSLGQLLVRKSSCLQCLFDLFKKSFSFPDLRYQQNNNWLDSLGSSELEMWKSVTSAICVCVNNPQNDDNQLLCCTIFPFAFKILQEVTQGQILRPVLSLIGLAVASNAQNQNRINKCNGVDILASTLFRLVNKVRHDDTMIQLAVHVASTINSCITDNVENARHIGDLGCVPLLLQLLGNPGLDTEAKVQVIVTIGHCVDGCVSNQHLFVESSGVAVLVGLMSETDDEELNRAIKYVLQTCIKEDSADKIKPKRTPLRQKAQQRSNTMDSPDDFQKFRRVLDFSSAFEEPLDSRNQVISEPKSKIDQILEKVESSEKKFSEMMQNLDKAVKTPSKMMEKKVDLMQAENKKLELALKEEKSLHQRVLSRLENMKRAEEERKRQEEEDARKAQELAEELERQEKEQEVKVKVTQENDNEIGELMKLKQAKEQEMVDIESKLSSLKKSVNRHDKDSDMRSEDKEKTNNTDATPEDKTLTTLKSNETVCQKSETVDASSQTKTPAIPLIVERDAEKDHEMTGAIATHCFDSSTQTFQYTMNFQENLEVKHQTPSFMPTKSNDSVFVKPVAPVKVTHYNSVQRSNIRKRKLFISNDLPGDEVQVGESIKEYTTPVHSPNISNHCDPCDSADESEFDFILTKDAKKSKVTKDQILQGACTTIVSKTKHSQFSVTSASKRSRRHLLAANLHSGRQCVSVSKATSQRQVLSVKPLTPSMRASSLAYGSTIVAAKFKIYEDKDKGQETPVSIDDLSVRVNNLKCPGCQAPVIVDGPILNSRTFNIALETSQFSCNRHRSIRNIERKFVHKRSYRGKQGKLRPWENFTDRTRTVTENAASNTNNVYDFHSSDSDGCLQRKVSPPSSPVSAASVKSVNTYLNQRRERIPYSEEEEANLLKGVAKFGTFWKQILCGYKFHPSRTAVDLKDKYKRMKVKEVPAPAIEKCSHQPFSMCEERRLKRGVRQYGYNWKGILMAYRFNKGRTAEELRNKWRSMHRGTFVQ